MNKNYILVVPVYNEAARAPENFYKRLLLLDLHKYIFVDDGSVDNSREVINKYMNHSSKVEWIVNGKNIGKAESLRKAMISALGKDNVIITADADGAIEVADIERLILKFEECISKMNTEEIIYSGARVRLAGSRIERTPMRQWIGRIVATLVNLITKIDMYDPQSPLKIYSITNPKMEYALASRFKTRWFCEMELILRLSPISNNTLEKVKLFEVPIETFNEVPGSNLKKRHIFKVITELYLLLSARKFNERNFRPK